jgi:phage terminase large subunit-like protein
VQWGEQEPGSGGKDAAAAFVRLLAGFNVHTEPTTGDKASAMDPLAAQWQAGNVRLVAGDWNAAFLDEAAAAPFGRNDDAIEAASRAYSKLAVPTIEPRVRSLN